MAEEKESHSSNRKMAEEIHTSLSSPLVIWLIEEGEAPKAEEIHNRDSSSRDLKDNSEIELPKKCFGSWNMKVRQEQNIVFPHKRKKVKKNLNDETEGQRH